MIFFENSQKFIQNEDPINQNITYNANFCYIKKNYALSNNIQLSHLCYKFVKFFQKLNTAYNNNSTKYCKYREYLNYR